MYGLCDIRHDRHCFFVILGHFLPFDPLNNPLKSKFWKNEKRAWRYYFTLLYHKWPSRDAWFSIYEVQQNFLSFCIIFSPFTPLATQKTKTLKNWKKDLEISSFYICLPQMTVTWCMVPQIWSTIDRILANFLPYPNNNPEIEILKKWKKKPWRYHHFTVRCTKSHNPILYCSRDMA